MRKLPDNFQRNCFSYRKIRRIGLVCLFEATNVEGLIYYFVFKVEERPSKMFKKKYIPAYERMPRAELYGRSGWILMNLDLAKIKFDSLVKRKQIEALERQSRK